ncbi:hypothetical protein GCM10027347_17600 [Larkinella harenae]
MNQVRICLATMGLELSSLLALMETALMDPDPLPVVMVQPLERDYRMDQADLKPVMILFREPEPDPLPDLDQLLMAMQAQTISLTANYQLETKRQLIPIQQRLNWMARIPIRIPTMIRTMTKRIRTKKRKIKPRIRNRLMSGRPGSGPKPRRIWKH